MIWQDLTGASASNHCNWPRRNMERICRGAAWTMPSLNPFGTLRNEASKQKHSKVGTTWQQWRIQILRIFRVVGRRWLKLHLCICACHGCWGRLASPKSSRKLSSLQHVKTFKNNPANRCSKKRKTVNSKCWTHDSTIGNLNPSVSFEDVSDGVLICVH